MKTPDAATLEHLITEAMGRDDWATVNDLEPRLDNATPPRDIQLGASALWYAKQGLHVFPLQPGLKIPYRGTRGLHEATNNPDKIREWWTFRPPSNIAIATGHLVDVIDIDGETGVRSWLDNWQMIDQLTHLGHVSTPRHGGTHIYIPAAEHRRNKAGLLPGIDYRGLGGYVVAPPSNNEQNVRYTWRTPLKLGAIG